jgi:glycosyltransferase involved in cell wall biosynthesis
MQNKLLEYMAMAKPVVATSVANEGIGAPPDECLLIEDTPRGFADAVVRLLRDPARSAQLGMAARRYVERHWTWEAHFLKLEQAMLEVIDSARAGSVAS